MYSLQSESILLLYNLFARMANLLNWIIAYAERMQWVEAHSTQAETSLLKQKTLMSVFMAYLRKIILIMTKFYQEFNSLSYSTKVKIFIVTAVLSAYIAYKIIKKNRRKPPPPSPLTGITKISAAKKSASLLSMKQYCSHSQSEPSSEQETDKLANEKVIKKMTKQFKQYCTDIETQPQNGQYQTVMESKKDKIFFNLLGSYKQASEKQNELQRSGKAVESEQQQQFACQYGDQSQISPCHNIKSPKKDPPKINLS